MANMSVAGPHRRQVVAGLLASGGSLATSALPANKAMAQQNSDDDMQIVRAGDAEAEALARAYNPEGHRIPTTRYLCETPSHVQQALSRLRAEQTEFAIRTGGHCFGRYSGSDTAVIDLRGLNALEVDADRRILRCGPGVTLGELQMTAAADGLVAPSGWCTTVAVGGHTLGGGVGYSARFGGLLCDAMVEATMIDAEGRKVRASATENADLFWALRGGGGHLGVVTEYVYQLPALNAPNVDQHVSWFSMTRRISAETAAAFLATWQDWAFNADRRLTSQCRLIPYPKGDFVFSMGCQMLDGGPALLQQLQRAPALFTTLKPENLFVGSWTDALQMHVLDAAPAYSNVQVRSDHIGAVMSVAEAAAFLKPLSDAPLGTAEAILEALGGAVADVPVTATAYPHREAAFLVQLAARENPEKGPEHARQVLEAVWNAWRPVVTGLAYVNYRDPYLENWAQAYWGENLPRLQQIKRKYDPEDIFGHPQGIPLS